MDWMKIRDKKPLYHQLTFDQLCDHYGLLDGQLITLLEVDKRTLASWRKKDNAPMMARKLITLHHRGLLSSDWEGFYIKDDTIHTPAGQRFTSGEILGFYYKFQLINNYQRENKRLKLKNTQLKSRITAANKSIFNEDGELRQLVLI